MTTSARRIVRQPALARGSAVEVMAKAMTEAQLQAAIVGMLDHYRLRWFHDTDSRKNNAGMPDLVIVGRSVEWWELKSHGGRLRPEQNEWLSSLVRAGAKVRVVRPAHLLSGEVQTWVRGLR